MEVTTVGGGPGGLYASLLLKRAHPDWSVTVHERNPPDVTYGWGIVFPDRGLSTLAEADPETHADITEAFTEWEPFDIHYRGERYRCGGHRFASLMRTDLLDILQSRCREVGVELEFESEVTDPAARAVETDLLIAADGQHSPTRAAFADALGTETVEGDARFSWFGTDQPFEALSHVFVETDDGLWCAHTYPGRTSTFIVDCDPETWANAGFDELAEAEYLAYLEDAFADYLDGHALRSEQDRWRTFTTVRNDSWYHDNVVLVGDAAHTAHYSIGSGTTLALEDGIGLARAFDGYDGDLENALAEYESRRQSFVEPLQAAGERSRRHFESIRRFYGTPGPRFAAHHLTRSGRLTYGSLRARDPRYVDELDRWFAAAETPLPAEAIGDAPGPPADQPLALAGATLPNRFVGVAEPSWSSSEGTPSASALRAFVDRSRAGAGLALTEPLAVEASGRPTPGSPGLYDDDQRDSWTGAVEEARAAGDAVLGAHLVHAGARSARDPGVFGFDGSTPHSSAWAPPLRDAFAHPPSSFVPGAMSATSLTRVRDAFADVARRADEAGFGYLQLHAGPGTLLGAFHSPLANDRDDEYGGSPEARRRYPLEVVEAVSEAWPADAPLGVTLTVGSGAEEGLAMTETIAFASALADAGVDLVAPIPDPTGGPEPPDPAADRGGASDHLRHAADVRTLATPLATDRDTVDTLVATGRADCCTFAGALET
ncbi:MAG: FAD-dependent monooxygenase [Halobacteriales archaeon]|nr:FAD-dependent monooxygenase [Halobacteriales archaeon]